MNFMEMFTYNLCMKYFNFSNIDRGFINANYMNRICAAARNNVTKFRQSYLHIHFPSYCWWSISSTEFSNCFYAHSEMHWRVWRLLQLLLFIRFTCSLTFVRLFYEQFNRLDKRSARRFNSYVFNDK